MGFQSSLAPNHLRVHVVACLLGNAGDTLGVFGRLIVEDPEIRGLGHGPAVDRIPMANVDRRRVVRLRDPAFLERFQDLRSPALEFWIVRRQRKGEPNLVAHLRKGDAVAPRIVQLPDGLVDFAICPLLGTLLHYPGVGLAGLLEELIGDLEMRCRRIRLFRIRGTVLLQLAAGVEFLNRS